MIDADAIVDQTTRRKAALAGNPNAWNKGGAYRGPREDAVSPLDRPELLWPEHRHHIPRACWHCGIGSANFEVDAPYGDRPRGEVRCLACSRVIVRLRALGAGR